MCGRSLVYCRAPAGCGIGSIYRRTDDGRYAWMLEQQPFPLEYRKIDLFSNEFMQLPVFDVVIFTGVLYHVQDPLEALKRLRSRMREMAIMETLIDESFGIEKPIMIYYENDELNRDPTTGGAKHALLGGDASHGGFFIY